MPITSPINFKNWIEEHRHLLKPPVGNRVVYDEGDFMIMVVGGPNSRKDYHVDTVEEFFYQLEGDMLLKIMEDGKRVNIQIKEGEIFFECDKMIHEVTLDLENIVTQLPPLFEAYWNSLDARTCESCGAVQEKP